MKKLSKEELRNIFMEEISPNDDLFDVFCRGYELGKEKKDKYNYDLISEYFVYDETSPSCVRTIKGGKTGHLHQSNYYMFSIKVGSKTLQYYAHRIIPVLHGLNLDGLVVDHIDGNSLNNRIDNLRVTSHKTNSRNRKIRKNNWYGISGVYFSDKSGIDYFVASCHVRGKVKTKTFNISRLGIMEAFAAAVKHREDMMEEAEKDGNIFTDRHKGL